VKAMACPAVFVSIGVKQAHLPKQIEMLQLLMQLLLFQLCLAE